MALICLDESEKEEEEACGRGSSIDGSRLP